MYHKIAVTSDNHINILFETESETDKLIEEQIKHIKEQNITHYIINGDISWNIEQVNYYLNQLEFQLKGFCDVFYTLGNHDLSRNFSIEEYFNIQDKRYLPNNEIVLETQKKVIIGNDGFFDYTYIEDHLNEDMLYDLNKYAELRYFKDGEIERNKSKLYDLATYEPKSPFKPKDILNKLLENAESKLKHYSDKGYEIIYITHYIPKQEFVLPNTTDDSIFKNAFMGSSLIGELLEKYNVKNCYFGHTHRRLGNKTINGVTYNCNPVGLPKNWVEHGIEDSDFITEWKKTLTLVSEVEDTSDLKPIYRGKAKKTNKWVVGNLVISESNINTGSHFILPELSAIEVDEFGFQIGHFTEINPETVGKYTGIDNLFTGDIVQDSENTYAVKWSKKYLGFRLFNEDGESKPLSSTTKYSVIGNTTEGIDMLLEMGI